MLKSNASNKHSVDDSEKSVEFDNMERPSRLNRDMMKESENECVNVYTTSPQKGCRGEERGCDTPVPKGMEVEMKEAGGIEKRGMRGGFICNGQE